MAVNKNSSAFTILEVMIFTALLSIVLVSSAAFVSRLVYNLRINEHRIYASHYATEVQEWLSSEREADWNNLFTKASAAGSVYCLNQNILHDSTLVPIAAGVCGGANSGFNGINGITSQPQIFKRELTLTLTNANIITATIMVTWNEGLKQYTEQIESIYTSY